jgi:hypothetical protein
MYHAQTHTAQGHFPFFRAARIVRFMIRTPGYLRSGARNIGAISQEENCLDEAAIGFGHR